jgi:hypothetical protein
LCSAALTVATETQRRPQTAALPRVIVHAPEARPNWYPGPSAGLAALAFGMMATARPSRVPAPTNTSAPAHMSARIDNLMNGSGMKALRIAA